MPKTLAIVVNPTKFDDLEELRTELTAQAQAHHWDNLIWFETDKDDDGLQAAKDALSHSPDLVCACGGDGTVRTVGAVLQNTAVPLGIIPAGTGNLLARNLGLPLDDPAAALSVALTGTNKQLDVGQMIDGNKTHTFLVAAGVGMDAEIMKSTDTKLKKHVGWLAYLAAGARVFVQRGFRTKLTINGKLLHSKHARMVLVCNCATLPAGINLAVNSTPDDGQLDVILLRPTGLFSWLAVTISILFRRRHENGPILQRPGQQIELATNRTMAAEVDGDVIGHVNQVRFTINPGGLLVRTP